MAMSDTESRLCLTDRFLPFAYLLDYWKIKIQYPYKCYQESAYASYVKFKKNIDSDASADAPTRPINPASTKPPPLVLANPKTAPRAREGLLWCSPPPNHPPRAPKRHPRCSHFFTLADAPPSATAAPPFYDIKKNGPSPDVPFSTEIYAKILYLCANYIIEV